MKLSYLALISSLVLTPLAAGRPHRHHDPRQLRGTQRRVGGRKNFRGTQRRASSTKCKQGAKSSEDCDKPHPLPKLENGCPCFDLERITSQMDYSEAVYCDLFEYAGSGDTYEHISFNANAEVSLRCEPPVLQDSYVTFGVDKETEPGFDYQYCYASIDNGEHTGDDYESEMYQEAIGEIHLYYLDVKVTDEEYMACANVLDALKAQLPANCIVEE